MRTAGPESHGTCHVEAQNGSRGPKTTGPKCSGPCIRPRWEPGPPVGLEFPNHLTTGASPHSAPERAINVLADEAHAAVA